MQESYYSLNSYLKQCFGEKVYKISLDLGLSCPNRDGTLDTRGCIFCNNGSSHFAAKGCDISEQIARARELISKKTDAKLFIAYFQSFTNTYAPAEQLEPIFKSVAERQDIAALSIATRPDCLPSDILQMLERLARIKPIFVELGLQTANEKTAEYIRRCYKNEVYCDAVARLKAIGINVVTHVIIGLPNETREDILKTVKLAVDSGTNGIKLQLLHILRGTDLYDDYVNGKVFPLSIEEYMDILFDCIEHLPEETVVHRITGDAPKALLAEPKWSADKKTVLNTINRELKARGIRQGRLYNV
ncbi:MAG: TIGR01212 family radical SAM protein [Clostridia bacterium]|nr:TIGR01212 family radical SAM protein [Clostridia bacterium]MBQ9847671.1 TIGR01212 family radical SAM protein [Clostridia bacterium]